MTNLGKYNEGQLVYERVAFPTDTETVQAALKKIGIDGIRYEEIFIADYDGGIPQLYEYLIDYIDYKVYRRDARINEGGHFPPAGTSRGDILLRSTTTGLFLGILPPARQDPVLAHAPAPPGPLLLCGGGPQQISIIEL